MSPLGAPIQAARLAGAPLAANHAQALKTATDFEQVFLNTMLSQMFTDLPTDGITGGGHAEEQWRGLLVDAYAKEITATGGLGVKDAIYRELIALQEVS